MDTRGIFLDVEGAFDAITHFWLVHKLRSYGFNADIVELIKSYLSNRKLRVIVNNSLSSGLHQMLWIIEVESRRGLSWVRYYFYFMSTT
jgi:hypothetical protein